MKNDKNKCEWVGNDPLDIEYHDFEWGIPVYDDKKLFEMLILEGAQAGLSWSTILKKRENYQKAFDDFDIQKVSNFNQSKIKILLNNEGIIRNKLKINSAVHNAQVCLNIISEYGSFQKYLWSFVDHKPIRNSFKSFREIPPTTEISD